MSAVALSQRLARRVVDSRDTAAALGLFAGTLFLSALLLFSVQPMFARMVLPKLGGSPSVWAVSMCFFQAVLLAGYCYAWALNRFIPSRAAPLVHLVVLAVAVLALPIGLPAGRTEPPAGDASAVVGPAVIAAASVELASQLSLLPINVASRCTISVGLAVAASARFILRRATPARNWPSSTSSGISRLSCAAWASASISSIRI